MGVLQKVRRFFVNEAVSVGLSDIIACAFLDYAQRQARD
jgi:hypothetical protein